MFSHEGTPRVTSISPIPARPALARPLGLGRALARHLRRSPTTAFAAGVLLLIVLVAIFAPYIAPYDPLQLHRVDRLMTPNATYLLGTDQTGRDELSRIIYGARVSLWVGFAPIALSVVVGGTVGVVSGYFGGEIDSALQRVMDAFIAFPPLVLVLVTVSLLGSTLTDVVFALAFVFLPVINRVARASTLSVLSLPFIEAARATGASHPRIITFHVVPNVVAPVLVVGTSLVGTAILSEAGLSFLGLGVAPPQPTWGNMLSGESRNLFEVAPWLAIFPGLAITLSVLAFNLLGDGVRDLLDPRFNSTGGRGRSGMR